MLKTQLNLTATLAFILLLAVNSLTAQTLNGTTPTEASASKSTLLPFYESFDTEESLNQWTILNNNGGSTWRYFEGTAAYLLDFDNQADDDLISPAFELDATKVYKFAFEATIPSTSNVTENFSVVVFNQVSATTTLANYPNYADSENKPKQLTVSVPTSGFYYFGFHEYSEPNRFRLMIDNVEVSELGNAAAPGAITHTAAIAAKNGLLADTLRFKAPVLTYGGTTLSAISAIEVYRNGDDTEPVFVFENPTPGQTYQWIDTNPVNGINTYQIYIYNSFGFGPKVELAVFVGTDIPVAPTVPSLKNSNGKAIIAWSVPEKGTHNGYLNPSALTYRIVRNDGTEVAKNLTDTTYIDENPFEGDDQILVNYSVFASSTTGEGNSATTNQVIFGKPYAAPFAESFADASAQNGPWASYALQGDEAAAWSLVSYDDNSGIEAQDADNGFISFNAYYVPSGSTNRMVSPLIDLQPLSNPVLGFWLYHYVDEWSEETYHDRLQVQVSANDSAFVNLGSEIEVSANNNGWTYYELPLIDYRTSEKISLGFLGISDYGFNLLVDNISIRNAATNDLAVALFNGPKRVTPGTENEYRVTLKNKGANAVSNYTVTLYRADSVLASAQGESIAPNAEYIFAFPVTASLNDITTGEAYYPYYAKVSFDPDEAEANNVSDTLKVTVRTPEYPVASGLAASVTHNAINLSWVKPEARPEATFETVIDSIETYEPFAISNIGDWTMLDLDGDLTLYSPRLVNYSHKGEPMAFQVFNADSLLAEEDYTLLAHSGVQYLACPSSNLKTNNDWLISPLLSAKEQTISFWAYEPTELFGNERMVVWYSTTDKHPDSFIKLSEGDYLEAFILWREYSFDLPEGARYFAIQCVSANSILLFIDDLTFERAIGDPETLALQGYNVYCNGAKVNAAPVTSTLYTDNKPNGTYTYTVTAVYDKGESAYSAPVQVEVTTAVETENAVPFIVYGEQGAICIKNAHGQAVRIVSADGRVVHSALIDGTLQLPCKQGLYIVQINHSVVKVVVH